MFSQIVILSCESKTVLKQLVNDPSIWSTDKRILNNSDNWSIDWNHMLFSQTVVC